MKATAPAMIPPITSRVIQAGITWITRLVIVGLLAIVLSGLLFGGGSFANFQTPATGYVPHSWTDTAFIKAMFGALLAAFWAYEGWNTLGFIGGEIKNPNRNLPLALFTGMMVIIGAYVIVNFTYLYVLPIDELVGVHQAKNDIAAVAVVRHFAGGTGATLISIIILLTTLGCTNSTILMPPRVYYAMAKDGLFFPRAAEINPVSNTPNPALWMQGAWACLLVLSGSFILLFVFWEAVGLCSYLLIGFWFQKPSAAAAAKKAFVVNRIGDFGLIMGIFLIWTNFGSLDFVSVLGDSARIAAVDAANPGVIQLICFCLFLGAMGKSAQFPLQVWLPDAMEGPTPVSALIHAATMVTAGVYLVARCTPLFVMAPYAQMAVSGIGAATAAIAALTALTQTCLLYTSPSPRD